MSDAASRALTRAVIGTLALGAGKAVAAWFTGSQAVAASAADSLTDAVISAANRWMVVTAARPPDPGHPYGHGKAEALASLLQVVALGGVIGGVAVRATLSLRAGAPAPIALPAGVVMAVSLAGSWALSHSLGRVADATGSLVVRSDAVHYRMDLWTGGAVIVGLVVSAWTGSGVADGVASLVVCAIMARDVGRIAVEAVGELMDRALDPADLATVEGVLEGFRGRVGGWHDLRTRRAGPRRFVQVHIELPGALTLSEAHRIADEVEAALGAALPGVDAIVHVDEAPDG